MIEIAPRQLSASAHWFPSDDPGPGPIGEHALATGVGHWWADRAVRPQVIAVSCAGHAVLRGDPANLTPQALAPLADQRIDAPARFLPALTAAFGQLSSWDRMAWTQQAAPQKCTTPRGITVRRLEPADTDALHALSPDAAWISASWGGALGLASSGHGWAAVDRGGHVLTVACTYFRGRRYEDVAVLTAPDPRHRRLALACVTALTADITARGHTPSWNCSALDRAGRLLAWTAGFRLVREYVHYATRSPELHELLTT
ncbi:GNAT family N-acetyltransferase [Streptomyces sp. NPDC059002]|uniref:GNAT family N-acetyltransferase n=1 Tax=Streptomyces sp. NPDC059002 TaxID=3346690 RepID=UPI0036AD3821